MDPSNWGNICSVADIQCLTHEWTWHSLRFGVSSSSRTTRRAGRPFYSLTRVSGDGGEMVSKYYISSVRFGLFRHEGDKERRVPVTDTSQRVSAPRRKRSVHKTFIAATCRRLLRHLLRTRGDGRALQRMYVCCHLLAKRQNAPAASHLRLHLESATSETFVSGHK